jgi:hypothetical protein
MNQRAPKDREKLFAALVSFANCGDKVQDLNSFGRSHPTFFPTGFYEQSRQLAVAGKKGNFFNWYKRQLRTVWEVRDPDGTRLEVLLGIREMGFYGFEGGDFQAEMGEYQAIQADLIELWHTHGQEGVNLAANKLFGAQITADWHGGKLRYATQIDFQKALYLLMTESWRARLCRICRRYMIAAKPASLYCSIECSAEGRQKRDLGYWRTAGKIRRMERKASKEQEAEGENL